MQWREVGRAAGGRAGGIGSIGRDGGGEGVRASEQTRHARSGGRRGVGRAGGMRRVGRAVGRAGAHLARLVG
jgi:hypothetical protein